MIWGHIHEAAASPAVPLSPEAGELIDLATDIAFDADDARDLLVEAVFAIDSR